MKKEVLFLCTGNSCRSQIAEGLLRYYKNKKYNVLSAGINPSNVNSKAIKVMTEVGIDISNHTSKSVNNFLNKKLDIVVTVCDNAKESCPVFPGKVKKLHWSFEDPAKAMGTEEEILVVFREVRDQIKTRILKVL